MIRYGGVMMLLLWWCCACQEKPEKAEKTDRYPELAPDYIDVAVPCNIAPLNFKVKQAVRCLARFYVSGKIIAEVSGDSVVDIPLKKWRNVLEQAKGKEVSVEILARGEQRKWMQYAPFRIRVAPDSIDSYMAYRLIEPGYEMWGKMGIYQRNLSTFEQKAIVENRLLGNGCVNCHSFHNYSPDKFMFHVRKQGGGTVVVENGKVEKLNLKTPQTIGQGTYPMWHPSGKYIAFSVNTTRQAFHAYDPKKIEVYDLESDLIVYDVEHKQVTVDKRFNEKKNWETFPAWSPDGKWLYFCRGAAKNMPFDYKQLKYGIYRVGFDVEKGVFADSIELIVDTLGGKSADFPRISPDGRYLLYTQAECGTFPIWHKEADLKLRDLQTGRDVSTDAVNSEDVESYHSWSSNGRWIVFSSRRMDGLYTRPYIAWFDASGKIHKPFLVPQKDPDYYKYFLKSYNIPEFVKGEINKDAYELSRSIEKSEAIPVSVK